MAERAEGEFELEGMEAKREKGAEHEVAKFDMTLLLQEERGAIVGGVEYARALFEGETIARYVGYFRTLLEGMVAR